MIDLKDAEDVADACEALSTRKGDIKSEAGEVIRALIAEVRSLREAAQEVLDWTEAKHRPPVPEVTPCGEMAGVRVHALVKLHQAMRGDA